MQIAHITSSISRSDLKNQNYSSDNSNLKTTRDTFNESEKDTMIFFSPMVHVMMSMLNR